MDHHSEPLLTPKEACALLRCSRAALQRWLVAGLPHLRAGTLLRFRVSELIEWAERDRGHRESAKAEEGA